MTTGEFEFTPAIARLADAWGTAGQLALGVRTLPGALVRADRTRILALPIAMRVLALHCASVGALAALLRLVAH